MNTGLSSTLPVRDTAKRDAAPVLRRERIALDLIDVPTDRLRRLDQHWAEVIGQSMAQAGQFQNIGLIDTLDGRFELNFGLHRLAGARKVGMTALDAAIRVDDGSGRRDEVFENLIRAPLCALDRAIYLAELKVVHEQMHPQTRNGAQGGRGSQRNESEIFAFSKIAADRTGLSRRSIELAVQIVGGLESEVIARVRGTAIEANQGTLIVLARQSANLQRRILDILLAPVAERLTDQIAEAIILAEGKKLPTSADRLWRSVNDKVARLKPAARQELFESYESEIRDFAKTRGWL